MKSHKVDTYVPLKSTPDTYGRGEKNKPRVFQIEELDGFYVDKELDRTVHISFDEEDVIVIDVYDTTQAAHKDTGEALGIIEVNLRTGKAKFFTEGR